MTDNGITRVQYYERQFLRTQDFTDEQAYHIAMRRRHNIGHHTWGIVCGLTLVADKDGTLAVQPGMAIDGYGRELIVDKKRALPIATFENKDSDVLDVWLIYNRESRDQAPAGYAGCRTDEELPEGRWREHPILRLDVPDLANPDRRSPPGVPPGDVNFTPSRTPPDEGQWPVFLGQILRNLADKNKPYSVDMSDRPYAGLIGEQIKAPSGQTWVQIGAEAAADERRFAVFIPEAEPKPKPEEPLQPQLSIDKQGHTTIRGDTTMNGRLLIKNNALVFGSISDKTSIEAAQPLPWRIYRATQLTKVEQLPGTPSGKATQTDLIVQQLRIEMAASQGSATDLSRNQVVIGVWSPDEKKFKACLTVKDDCSVQIHGNLIVEGRLTEKQPRPEQRLTPEARNLTLASSLTGIAGASALLPNFYKSQLDADFVKTLLSSKTEMQRIFASLQSDEQRTNFAAQLGEGVNGPIQTTIIEQLVKVNPNLLTDALLKTPARMQLIFTAVTALEQANNFASQLVKPENGPLQQVMITQLVQSNTNAVIVQIIAVKKKELIAKLLEEHAADLITQLIAAKKADVIAILVKDHAVDLITQVVQKEPTKVIAAIITAKKAELITKLLTDHAADLIKQVVEEKPDQVIAQVITDKTDDVIAKVVAEQTSAVIDKVIEQAPDKVVPVVVEKQSSSVIDQLLTQEQQRKATMTELLTRMEEDRQGHSTIPYLQNFVDALNTATFSALKEHLKTLL